MADTRKNVRVAIYNGPDQQKLMTNYTVNMSTGGVFIETENIRPVDTVLELNFKLPDNDLIISCKARVAWVNEPGDLKKSTNPPGMGIQFLDLSFEKLHAIRNFLKECDLKPVW